MEARSSNPPMLFECEFFGREWESLNNLHSDGMGAAKLLATKKVIEMRVADLKETISLWSRV